MQAGESDRFTRTRHRPGYSIAEVEALIEKIEGTLGLRPRFGAPVSAADVVAAQFRIVRLTPGYEMREVDDALDHYEQLLRAQGWE